MGERPGGATGVGWWAEYFISRSDLDGTSWGGARPAGRQQWMWVPCAAGIYGRQRPVGGPCPGRWTPLRHLATGDVARSAGAGPGTNIFADGP